MTAALGLDKRQARRYRRRMARAAGCPGRCWWTRNLWPHWHDEVAHLWP